MKGWGVLKGWGCIGGDEVERVLRWSVVVSFTAITAIRYTEGIGFVCDEKSWRGYICGQGWGVVSPHWRSLL